MKEIHLRWGKKTNEIFWVLEKICSENTPRKVRSFNLTRFTRALHDRRTLNNHMLFSCTIATFYYKATSHFLRDICAYVCMADIICQFNRKHWQENREKPHHSVFRNRLHKIYQCFSLRDFCVKREIKIPQSKTRKKPSFLIDEKVSCVQFLALLEKSSSAFLKKHHFTNSAFHDRDLRAPKFAKK